jgi:hypothetical protein
MSIVSRVRNVFVGINRIRIALRVLKKVFKYYDKISETKTETTEKAASVARQINDNAHKSPWPYVSTAAFIGVASTMALRSLAKGGMTKK